MLAIAGVAVLYAYAPDTSASRLRASLHADLADDTPGIHGCVDPVGVQAFSLTVTAQNGRVQRVDVDGVSDADASACLVQRVQGWAVPDTPRSVRVQIPVEFR